MKKLLTKIIGGALALCMLCSGLIACGGASGWQAGQLKDGGNVISSSGFIAETEKYLYYINGSTSVADDNAFGVPVKGSLMAVKKDTLNTANPETEIVVPKIFSATDYKAGLFIDGGYVYYGTPNTEKNSSGEVATTEMTFMRTKLDGSGQTDVFFTVGAHSTEYRIVKGENAVYIVYYNSDDSALISYNTSTKEAKEIIKTDDKAETLSLASYKFVEDGYKDKAVVLYTTTVYTEAYDEAKAEKKDYVRQTATYNQLYAYKVGAESGELVLDGIQNKEDALDDATYSFKLIKNGYVFYTANENGATKTYGITLTELLEKKVATAIKNDAYVTDSAIIETLESVYVLESGVVYKTTLIEADNQIKNPVAKSDSISTMLFVDGNELYYLNSSTKIAKVELKDVQAGEKDKVVNEIRISEDTVASAWYKPQVITVGEAKYLFYLDNSALGNSYVKYVDVNNKTVDNGGIIAEDTDDDGVNDLFYINPEKIAFLGQKTKADQAKYVTTMIDNLSNELVDSTLDFEEKDGKLVVESVDKVKALYDAIADQEVKDLVNATSIETLNDYVKAIEIANEYNKLKGIENYNTKDHTADNIPENIKTAYEQMKDKIEEFKASEDRGIVDGYINDNLKYYYQLAEKFFEAK